MFLSRSVCWRGQVFAQSLRDFNKVAPISGILVQAFALMLLVEQDGSVTFYLACFGLYTCLLPLEVHSLGVHSLEANSSEKFSSSIAYSCSSKPSDYA